LAEFETEKQLAQGWQTAVEAWIGITYAEMGETERAQQVVDKLLLMSKQTYVAPTLPAILYFVLGEDDRGFQMLDKAFEEYDSWLRLLKVEPIFDRVRSDPRFVEMLKKRGFEK